MELRVKSLKIVLDQQEAKHLMMQNNNKNQLKKKFN